MGGLNAYTNKVNNPPTVTLTTSPLTICEGQSITLTANSIGETTQQEFSGSSSTVIDIPNNNTAINSTINLSASAGITIAAADIIEVKVNIEHTRDSDLDFFLVDPSGTKFMTLSTDNGGTGDNYTNTIFRTGYGTSITLGSAPFNSTFSPEGSINDLIGAAINGNWTLQIWDDQAGVWPSNSGRLMDWSISITKQVGNSLTTVFEGPGTDGTSYSGLSPFIATSTITPPAGTNIYTAKTTDGNGCSATSNQVSVVVNPLPNPTITADYCAVIGKIRLTADALAGSTFLWSTGETGNMILVDVAGDYSVTATTPAGCTGTTFLGVADEKVTHGNFTNWVLGDFTTGYTYKQDLPGLVPAGQGELYNDSGTNGYSITPNGQNVHINFWGRDHTTGTGNFMAVNGHDNLVVWEQTVTVLPNTYYYYSAWGMNINSANPARLQFKVNDTNIGTIAELNSAPKPTDNSMVNLNNWVRFYYGSTNGWFSGASTTAKIQIVDLVELTSGNDFGLDDISFGTLAAIPLAIDPGVVGGSNTICEGGTLNLTTNITGGKAPYTYSWTGPLGFTSTIETPSIPNAPVGAAGVYSVTVQDGYGCTENTDNFTVAVNAAAVANAGPDQTACSTSPAVTLAGWVSGSAVSGTWSGGGGTFAPNNTTLNAVYTPSASEIAGAGTPSGIVTLTLTTNDPAGPCAAVSDPMTITVNKTPTVSISSFLNPECNAGTNGFATASGAGGTLPYSYSWNTTPVQSVQTAIDLSAGTYTVTITDANLCTATANVTLTEPDPLILNDPTYNEPTCYGASDGTATISLAPGSTTATYSWNTSPVQTTPIATGLAAGHYIVTVTAAGNCAVAKKDVFVTQPAVPTISCPSNITISSDAGLNYASDVPLVSPVYNSNCQTLAWTMSAPTAGSGSGLVPTPFTFNVGETTIEYTATDLLGGIMKCPFTVTVTPNGPPVLGCRADLALKTDSDYCSAVAITELPTLNSGTQPIDWIWSITNPGSSVPDANGTFTGSPGSPGPPVIGNYQFLKGITTIAWRATNAAGFAECTQLVTVADDKKPTITCPAQPDAICAGSAGTYTHSGTSWDATATDNCTTIVSLNYTLTGSTTGTGTSLNGVVFSSGTTTVTWKATDAVGNFETCSYTVTINALPTITGTLSVCTGSTTTLTGSATPDATTPWVSATPAVATISDAGVVTGVAAGTSIITYTNNNGCSITAIVTVYDLPTITGTLTVCTGSTTTLTGSATPDAATPWVSATPAIATVSNTGVVTGLSAGTSVITYTNNNGCSITATVTVYALPTITGTQTVCIGSTTTLTGSATPDAATPWVSATPAVATINNAGEVTGDTAGTSVITYTNNNGCSITATVTVYALPTITGTLTVCAGSTTTLTGSGTPDAATPWVSATPAVATVSNTGVVTGVSAGTSVITYTNDSGCSITATVTVNPPPTCSISGPTGPMCPLTLGNIYTAPAGMTYVWSITGNGTISGSSTAQMVTVDAGASCNVTFELSLSVTDGNSCTSSCIKTVTVADNTGPTITCPLAINIPASVNITNTTNKTYLHSNFLWDATAASDNCGRLETVILTANLIWENETETETETSSVDNTLSATAFKIGTTHVIWTATDACGKSSLPCASFDVVVLGKANINVAKTGSTNPFPGSLMHYTITVSNIGPALAQEITLTDNVPTASLEAATVEYSTSDDATLKPWTGSLPITNLVSGSDFLVFIQGIVKCNATGSIVNTASVVLSTLDDPEVDNDVSTYTTAITNSPVVVNSPSNTSLSACDYADQATIDAAFDNWLTGFSVSGGFSPTGSYGSPTAPVSCTGGITSVTYNTSDLCHTGSVTKTFTITPPSDLVASVGADPNLPSCSTSAEIQTAYDAWKAGFIVTGGCSPTDNMNTFPALTALTCGGSMSFTLIADNIAGGCADHSEATSTFTVAADNTDPVITCPPSIAAQMADEGETYATITLAAPVYSDDCRGVVTLNWTMTAPTFGTGTDFIPDNFKFNIGTTTVTYEVTDACGNKKTCSFTIEVTPNDPPVITCPGNLTPNTDLDLCTATLDPGFPTLVSGTTPIVYDWVMTGVTTGSGTGAIGSHTFNKGVTTITWTATNIAGSYDCTQTVTVTDKQAPTFDVHTPFEYCVLNISSAIYDGQLEPNADIIPLGWNPGDPRRPDWYIVNAGSTELDITNLDDNCCDPADLTISWVITFTDGVHSPISGTGQPSQYDDPDVLAGAAPNSIKLWGATNYTDIQHTITYTLTDCNSINNKTVHTKTITIKPRPNIVKVP